MLSAKPWTADAILRLGLSVIVCAFFGSLFLSVQHYFTAGAKVSAIVFLPLAAAASSGLVATLVLINKPLPPDALSSRLVAVMVCAYGSLLLSFWVQRLSGMTAAGNSIWRVIVASLSFQGAGLILVARLLRVHQIGWTEAFGFSNQPRRAVLLGLLAVALFLPLGWGLQQVSGFVMTHLPIFNMHPEEQLAVRMMHVSRSLSARIMLGVSAILVAPVAEEILFRGILYPAVKQAGFPQVALWGTSVLFAAIHMNLLSFVPLTVLALVLVALYERTNNLLAPITAHALFNAVNLVTLFLQEAHK
ncbi:MAG: CPBP family intramembrane metalloprotease [Verrucomicrobia bacterium]|nr:CPBP family intramembrane metalloprotease [Verrucomicrobiota bacterium]